MPSQENENTLNELARKSKKLTSELVKAAKKAEAEIDEIDNED